MPKVPRDEAAGDDDDSSDRHEDTLGAWRRMRLADNFPIRMRGRADAQPQEWLGRVPDEDGCVDLPATGHRNDDGTVTVTHPGGRFQTLDPRRNVDFDPERLELQMAAFNAEVAAMGISGPISDLDLETLAELNDRIRRRYGATVAAAADPDIVADGHERRELAVKSYEGGVTGSEERWKDRREETQGIFDLARVLWVNREWWADWKRQEGLPPNRALRAIDVAREIKRRFPRHPMKPPEISRWLRDNKHRWQPESEP